MEHHFGRHLLVAVILFGVGYYFIGQNVMLEMIDAGTELSAGFFNSTTIGIPGAVNVIVLLIVALLNFIIYYGLAAILLYMLGLHKKEEKH